MDIKWAAQAISELTRTGMSQSAIANALKKSQRWVSDVASGVYSDLRFTDMFALKALHENVCESQGTGRTQVLSSCHGKARFDSVKLARASARRLNNNNSAAVSPYKCQYCHGWHIGDHRYAKRSNKRARSDLAAIKAKLKR